MSTKIFAKTIENEALAQIEKMSACEAYKACEIRIMPDCHAGKGCTIGTVIDVQDRVVPNTVGVDIGCGMSVYYLGYEDLDLVKIDNRIRERVPSGFNIHNKAIGKYELLEQLYCRSAIDIDMANRSLGTLGGGNHFIEINKTADGQNVLVIHSGSRNLGVRVCNYYQKIAASKCGDKSNIVKVMPFGNHLRTNQNTRTSLTKLHQYLFMSIFLPCSIIIHTENRDIREYLFDWYQKEIEELGITYYIIKHE